MFLVVDSKTLIQLKSPVVVKGRQPAKVLVKERLSDPPVEPEDLRMILVDQLGRSRQPIV